MKDRILAFMTGIAIAVTVACSSVHDKSLEQLETPARMTRVFVFDPANAAQYPVTHTGFINAMHEWAKVIPVHFVITYDTKVWGIRVAYTDVNAPPYSVKGAVGAWYANWPTGLFDTIPLIVIDADTTEHNFSYTEMGSYATSVAAHEIGHMLGLSHIVDPGS